MLSISSQDFCVGWGKDLTDPQFLSSGRENSKETSVLHRFLLKIPNKQFFTVNDQSSEECVRESLRTPLFFTWKANHLNDITLTLRPVFISSLQ